MPRDGGETLTPRRAFNMKSPEVPTLKSLLGKMYDENLAYAFPDVLPPVLPCGKMILVQLRTPGNFKKLSGGKVIYYADESVDIEKFNIQTAVVRHLGPVAFRHRLDMTPFPEGEWAVPGEFIRVPKYGGDRIGVPLNDEQQRSAFFLVVNDTDITGRVYGDPLTVKGIL